MLNSIRLYTRDSTNRDLPDIPSPSQESPDISPTIRLQSPKDRPSSTLRSSLLLEQLPTISDSLMSLKDLRSLPWDSLKELERELLLPRDPSTLSISWLNLHPPEKVFSSWEVPEIEKPSVILVFTLVKRVPILLPESEPREENSRELEEEDDAQSIHLILTISNHSYNFIFHW